MKKTWSTDANGVEWISDENDNKNSVTYWGSKEAAEKALDSLVDCRYCRDCSDCRSCSYCSSCSDCSYCSSCSDCSSCRSCSYCSSCSDCSYCSSCSDCSYCSSCSSCSDCSYCSSCSDCSYCSEKNRDESAMKPLVIPKIANIHQMVYAAAASNPDSLNMADVHTCDNTHCRGGWVTTLAGPEGKHLEDFLGWEGAAMAIYAESGYPEINPARFFDDNATALADMKRLAEQEVAASKRLTKRSGKRVPL
jgi:hypothetical protein